MFSKKWTQEEFIQKSKEVHGEDAFDYSEVNFVDIKTKVILTCKNGHRIEQIPYVNINQKSGCLYCCGKAQKTTEQFIKESKEQFPGMFGYDKVDYKSNRKKVTLYCNEHEIYFDITPGSHFRKSRKSNIGGCPKCNRENCKKVLTWTTEKFIQRAKEVHGEDHYDYSLVDYKSAHTKVKIKCNIHKREILIKPHNHINRKQGCKLCKSSSGENYIIEFLKKHNIKFKPEKSFTKCRHKKLLRFDFCIFSNKRKILFLLEYHGQQHYMKVDFSGHMTEEEQQEQFELNRLRDEIKRKFCETNGYDLLVIPYTEFKNIDQILVEKFASYGFDLKRE